MSSDKKGLGSVIDWLGCPDWSRVANRKYPEEQVIELGKYSVKHLPKFPLCYTSGPKS